MDRGHRPRSPLRGSVGIVITADRPLSIGLERDSQAEASPNPDSRSGARMNDRAAVVTTAIMQMIATAPKHELRQAIEAYLRDEFADLARTALNEIRHEDE